VAPALAVVAVVAAAVVEAATAVVMVVLVECIRNTHTPSKSAKRLRTTPAARG